MDDFKQKCINLVNLNEYNGEENAVGKFQAILDELCKSSICVSQNGKESFNIKPLFIEGYIAKSKEEKNNPCHCCEKQRNHFMKFYFHKKGRGGVDLVISNNEIYASILLKSVQINESKYGQIYTGVELKKRFLDKDYSIQIKPYSSIEIKTAFCERILGDKNENDLKLACYRSDLISPNNHIRTAIGFYKRLYKCESLKNRN